MGHFNNVFKSDSCWLQNGKLEEAIIKVGIYQVNLSEARNANLFFGDLFEKLSPNLTKLTNFLKCKSIAIMLSETTDNRSVDEITRSFPLTTPDRCFQ